MAAPMTTKISDVASSYENINLLFYIYHFPYWNDGHEIRVSNLGLWTNYLDHFMKHGSCFLLGEQNDAICIDENSNASKHEDSNSTVSLPKSLRIYKI